MEDVTKVIERVKVEYTIIYNDTPEDRTDAMILSKVYQKMGFTISSFEYPKGDKKGHYVLRMECKEFDHPIFSIQNQEDYLDDFDKNSNYKPKDN
jgi:hypothetical protein